MKRFFLLTFAAVAVLTLPACIQVRTHSTVDPIYMTLDVNLKVQLQQELADVFSEIDAASETIND